MTQKLTLPIQVGKKYIRRDGKVVTAREHHADKASTCVYVGVQDVAECDSNGTSHAWKNSGLIFNTSREHQHDIVADYAEGIGHPHAEAMLEYAKDAAKMAEPWKNWEYKRLTDDWYGLTDHPTWSNSCEYRRKQHKVTINGIECVAGVKEPVYDELYYVAAPEYRDYAYSIRYEGAYRSYVERNLLYATCEDAIAAAKAMLNFQ